MSRLRIALSSAMGNALQVYEADREAGNPSAAFDAGRYDGLKQALAILEAEELP